MGDNCSPLTLGTVQLGKSYGIANRTGQPDRAACFAILDCARAGGIATLDTAPAYGESEEILGAYLRDRPGSFSVVTKLPKLPAGLDRAQRRSFLRDSFDRSRRVLRVDAIHALLAHDAGDFFSYRQDFEELAAEWRSGGVLRHFGLSVYEVAQLSEAATCDAFQFPFNLFDNAPARPEILNAIRRPGRRLFVRSVFLQGLFFLSAAEAESRVPGAGRQIERLEELAAEFSLSRAELCFGFAYHAMRDTASLVLGVETRRQLEDNFDLLERCRNKEAVFSEVNARALSLFRDLPAEVLKPYLW